MGDLEVTVAEQGARLGSLEVRFDRHEIKQNHSVEKIHDRLNSSQRWLMGIAGGIIVSLVLLVANLAIRG